MYIYTYIYIPQYFLMALLDKHHLSCNKRTLQMKTDHLLKITSWRREMCWTHWTHCLIMQAATGLKCPIRQVCIRLLEECPRTFTLTLLHLIVGGIWKGWSGEQKPFGAFWCVPSNQDLPGLCKLHPLSTTSVEAMGLQSNHRRTTGFRTSPACSGRTASWLHRVDACLDWLTVEGSSCLYRQGDEMSGFFMVLRPGTERLGWVITD